MLVMYKKRTKIILKGQDLAVPYRVKRTLIVCIWRTFTVFGKDGLTVYNVKNVEWWTKKVQNGKVTETTLSINA